MGRKDRVPLKLVLSVGATITDAETATRAPVESVELSPVHSAPDAPRPTFVPLALAIDMGQTGPIGSLTTATIDIGPSPAQVRPSSKPRPLAPARPATSGRRHLRLLPDP